MRTLDEIRAEYARLDGLLGIDTSGVRLSFSARMTRQYGVCCFRAAVPTEIRLAAFLQDAPGQLRQTALHEYAHAAAALLTGVRHGHDAVWKQLCVRIGCAPERLAPPCAAAEAAGAQKRAGKPVYLVVCRSCGCTTRYQRRGKIVRLLTQHPNTTACVCRRCGARRFQLEIQEETP